jgi:putative hydrolase of the HAD superfamily
MGIKLLIFDLDDTLYPEYQFVFSGYNAVASSIKEFFGIEDFDRDLKQKFIEGHRGDLFSKALSDYGIIINEFFIKNFIVSRYRNHQPQINLYDDFVSNLPFFSTYRLALITDGVSVVQRNKINALDINKLFDLIVVSSEIEEDCCKPSNLPYDKVLDYFSLKPDESVYIADNSKKDFIYPAKVKMHSIHLLNKKENEMLVYENEKPFPQIDAVCYSYDELVQVIKEI